MASNVKSPSVEMTGSGDNSEREEMVAVLLCRGKSQVEIERETGIPTRDIRRMQKRDEFQRLVRVIRRAVYSTAIGAMQTALNDVIARMALIAIDSENEVVAVRAGGVLMSHLLKYENTVDLTDRIAALEAKTAKENQIDCEEPDGGISGQTQEAGAAQETQANQGDPPLGPGPGGTAGAGIETPGPDPVPG